MPRRRAANEGSIYQTADGRWRAAVTVHRSDGSITRRYLSGKRRGDVQRKLREHQLATAQGQTAAPDRITVAAYLDGWLTTSAALRVRDSTLDDYRVSLAHVRTHLGATRLTELRRPVVQQMVATLAATLAPGTVRKIVRVLRTALERARHDGLITANPTDGLDLPRYARGEPHTLTPAQVRTLLTYTRTAAPADAVLYEVLLTTGLRISEALGLTWEDIDLDARVVQVRRRLRQRSGVAAGFAELKTPSSRRRLPLLPDTVTALRTLRDMDRPVHPSDIGTVFRSPTGRPDRYQSVWNRLQGHLAAAGLPRISVHALRHSFATLHLQAGTDMRTLADLLGHSTPSMTANVYAHVTPPLREQAAERLRALLEGGNG